jgi:large subunit ribosomal protein L13
MRKNKPNPGKYYLFNCENFLLGRMSGAIARLLQGKNSPEYAPNREADVFIIVINSDKLNVTGKKMSDKMYHTFSGYPGGISSRTMKETLEFDSRKIVWNSVYGMLPKNKLRDRMMKKMLIFKDEKHGTANSQIDEIKSF